MQLLNPITKGGVYVFIHWRYRYRNHGYGSSVITKKSVLVTPKNASTSNSGSGFGNTANVMRNFNGVSSTNTDRPHVADQNIAGSV